MTFHDNLAFSRLHTLGEDDDYKLTAEPDGNLFKLWFTFDGITELEDQALWGHVGFIFGDSGCDALAEGIYEGIGAGGTICKRFNGTNNYVQVLPSEHLTIQNRPQFSIFIRFKVDDVTQDQTLFEKFDDLSGSYAYKAIITNSRIVFMVNVGGTGYTKVNTTNLVNNTFYDVWMRRDGITLTIYINGSNATIGLNSAGFSEEGFKSGGFTTRFPPVEFEPIPTSTGVGTSLIIGSDGALEQFFKGYIQDFRIWSKLVSSTEISNQWTNKVSVSNIAFERCAVVGYAPIRSARRRSLSDTISFVDSLTATYRPTNPKLRTISQTITISDSITPLQNFIKPANVDDTFILDDSISTFRGATQVKVGSIIKSTQTTGLPLTVNHSTEIGFRPKFMLFWGSNATSHNIYEKDPRFFIGFSDGIGNVALCGSSNDGTGVADTAKGFYDSAILGVNYDNNLEFKANCTFSDTGFSLVYSNNNNNASIINYIALGGSTITNVKVGSFAQPTSALGVFPVTGVGFSSDCGFLLPTQFTAINTKTTTLGISFGAFNLSSQRFSLSTVDQDNVGTTVTSRIMRNNMAITMLGSEPTGIHTVMKMADINEITPTGFDLNYSVNQATGGTAGLCGYAALKGVKCVIGSFIVNTGTGLQIVTNNNINFKPLVLIFFANGRAAQTTATPIVQCKMAIGAATDSLNRRTVAFHDGDSLDVSTAVFRSQSNAALIIMHSDDNSQDSTILLSFDVTDIQQGQFTINKTIYDTPDTVEINYIALA